MNNVRFATALHILTLLLPDAEEWKTSDWIAGSININPVMVRKEIVALKKAGLIESRKGKEGGVRLAGNVKDIRLSHIYEAVNTADLLGRKNRHPNPKCPVGKHINKNLAILYSDANTMMMQFLSKKTLLEFGTQFS